MIFPQPGSEILARFIFLILILPALFAACGRSESKTTEQTKNVNQQSGEEIISVTQTIAVSRQVPSFVQTTGSLVADETSDVAPKTAGKVTNTMVKVGDFVQQGAVLAKLDENEARLASAAASRSSAEQLFESEQRQFRAGTSTVFLVLQRQNELVAARGRELQAQTDLNKAISAFQHSTGTTLSANSVEITTGTSPSFIFRRPVEFGSSIFRTAKDKSID